jgi:protein-disulfide isomerase
MKKIFFLLLVSAVVISGCTLVKPKEPVQKVLTLEEAKTKAENYINTNLMEAGRTATVKEAIEENGLFKLKVDVAGQNVDSYMTKDGLTFFPQGYATEEKIAQNDPEQADQPEVVQAEVPKSDKPVVELFIMSYCPYGTQIEKGMIPVAQALGNKIDFHLKFVNYVMHGEQEIKENLLEYCIQKVQNDKLLPYLSCFLEASDSAGCLTKVGVDTRAVEACTTEADKEFKITELSKDASSNYPPFNVNKAECEKYGVQGSPTLVINGQEASSGRDAASLLKVICSAFNTAPGECSQTLSSATPAPGFGSGTASDSASGSCN